MTAGRPPAGRPPGGRRPGGPVRRRAPGPAAPARPAPDPADRLARRHRRARLALGVASLAGALALTWIPARTWLDIRAQRADADAEAERLADEAADLRRLADRSLDRDELLDLAICVGPWVEPGQSVVTPSGVAGCRSGG